ncbi:RNA polymerase sigma factor [Cellulomonas sp. C5510]|uniref:RNA polymerase sigma factor n=1 Tax=Cellulomonas sp. C5510 TaxID=2871170 RepID=UPI002104D3BA|nr:RNA polymerase sigma factor [Cellulomonas sp. C5510]
MPVPAPPHEVDPWPRVVDPVPDDAGQATRPADATPGADATDRRPVGAAHLEDLYAAHARTVYRFARTRLDAVDAEDVVAEVFATVWRRGAPDLADPRAWLLAVARRVMANHIRSLGRRVALHDRLRALPPAVGEDGGALVDELYDLRRAIARLRPADREVIGLLAAAELSTAELASVLGCTPAGAATKVHRARRRLRAVYQALDREEG